MEAQINQKQLASKETYWYLKSSLLLIAILLAGFVKAYPEKIQNRIFSLPAGISEHLVNKSISENNTSPKEVPKEEKSLNVKKTDQWTGKKYNGKNGKHINRDAKKATEKKWQQAKLRLIELKQQKRTKEVAKQIKKTENQIKHWYRKTKENGETHWRRGK